MENLPLPDEIIVQILGYLSLGELIQCATVSKSFNTICKDSSLRYRSNMLVIKDLTVKDRKSIIDVLIARPKLREVTIISWRDENFNKGSLAGSTKRKKKSTFCSLSGTPTCPQLPPKKMTSPDICNHPQGQGVNSRYFELTTKKGLSVMILTEQEITYLTLNVSYHPIKYIFV